MGSDLRRKAKLNVLMVLDNPFPPDLRVRKEFTALIEKGHNVTLVCYRAPGQLLTENISGCKVIRSNRVITKKLKGIVDVYNALFFINPVIRRMLEGLKEDFDVIHVHDLPLSNTCLRFARKRGMKAILDLHENYPEAVKVWFAWRTGLLIRLKNLLFFNYSRWFKRERKMVFNFDATIAVVEEMKERLIVNHQVPEHKITVISNTESIHIFSDHSGSEPALDSNKIIYVGGIGPHRGIDTAIRGLAFLKDHPRRFQLIIVGSGPNDTINRLKDISRESDVAEMVTFTGQLPFDEAIGYMRTAFLNIIPHSRNGHTDNAIPHKLFQIMNSEYPLMVSSSSPLKRIVETYKAGVVFEADNPGDFARKVIWAHENRDELKKYSENAKNAVLHKGLNWETEAENLISMYESL